MAGRGPDERRAGGPPGSGRGESFVRPEPGRAAGTRNAAMERRKARVPATARGRLRKVPTNMKRQPALHPLGLARRGKSKPAAPAPQKPGSAKRWLNRSAAPQCVIGKNFREAVMTRRFFASALLASSALLAASQLAQAQSAASQPASPWPAGDEIG